MRNQTVRRIGCAFGCTAAGLNGAAEPGGDPRLRRQTDDESKPGEAKRGEAKPGEAKRGRDGQKPASTRRVLPRIRLR
jgi:hypothetical protein